MLGWLRKRIGIPIVGNLVEAPWPLWDNCGVLKKQVSPLYGVDGALVISRFLMDWAEKESKLRGRDFPIFYLPIVVDLHEARPDFDARPQRGVVFAGAPAYDATICFAVQAMQVVWQLYPDCELLVTGTALGTPEASRLVNQINSLGPKGPVRLCGLLARSDLLALYRQASALLIPLFADVRSIARFPIKIGEYLASGRPIVTSCVGEIPAFFQDGMNACVAIAGDPLSFGERIVRLIQNPAWASEIARNGWETARQHFHYSVHGPSLLKYFEHVHTQTRNLELEGHARKRLSLKPIPS
jgi:glycosyltransferase involved in cell wall biosynthesis